MNKMNKMNFELSEIAKKIDGNIEGDSKLIISSISEINNAKKGSITFLSNPNYIHFLYKTNASAVIINEDFKADKPVKTTLIKVKNAYESFCKVLNIYKKDSNLKSGIDKSSYIDKSSKIGKNVYIGAFCFVGKNVEIGKNVIIHPQCFIGDNVKINDNCIIYPKVNILNDSIIGKNCTFQSGVIIGSDGFGFAPSSDGVYNKIAQIGNVIIESNVEIGANTTIDRATIGSTIIREGVKLDNLIQIAHNVEIGKNTVIAAQSGIAGSTKIGKNCMIGGQVGIIGHLNIADNVKIAAQSGVGNNIEEKGAVIQGSPAFNIFDYKRSYVLFKNLTKLNNRIQKIEKELTSLLK